MKINWTDHIVNLFVVILGISIVFWLNSWAESNRAEKLEDQYPEGIIKDIEHDMDQMDMLTKYSEAQVGSVD